MMALPNLIVTPLQQKGVRNGRQFSPKNVKKRSYAPRRLSLEGPVGMQLGVLNLSSFLEASNTKKLLGLHPEELHSFSALCSCFIAFGEIFFTPETKWTSETLNKIFNIGHTLLQNSIKEKAPTDSPISSIPNRFQLNQHTIDVRVSEPILIGRMESDNPRIFSVIVGLEMIMEKCEHCLCEVQGCYFLIWKRKSAYFLYDCYGRNQACLTNHVNGHAALICVCSVRNIGLILQKMSHLYPDAPYTLYEICMKTILRCSMDVQAHVGNRQTNAYTLLTNSHAVLSGNLHIRHESFRNSLWKQGLTTALTGILLSKIEPPCSWDALIVDKLLLFGNTLFHSLVNTNIQNGIGIQDIPANVPLGQFVLTIQIAAQVLQTTWVAENSLKDNPTLTELRRLLTWEKTKNIIIQIDGKAYSIWKCNSIFYILDPYRSTIIDAAINPPGRNATVHMLDSIESLCSALHDYVIRAPIPTYCYIHVIKVVKIRKMWVEQLPESEQRMPCIALPKGGTEYKEWTEFYSVDSIEQIQGFFDDGEDLEASSLNESVCDIDGLNLVAPACERYDLGENDLDVPPFSEHNPTATNEYDEVSVNFDSDEGLLNTEKSDEINSRLSTDFDSWTTYKENIPDKQKQISKSLSSENTDSSGSSDSDTSAVDKSRSRSTVAPKRKGRTLTTSEDRNTNQQSNSETYRKNKSGRSSVSSYSSPKKGVVEQRRIEIGKDKQKDEDPGRKKHNSNRKEKKGDRKKGSEKGKEKQTEREEEKEKQKEKEMEIEKEGERKKQKEKQMEKEKVNVRGKNSNKGEGQGKEKQKGEENEKQLENEKGREKGSEKEKDTKEKKETRNEKGTEKETIKDKGMVEEKEKGKTNEKEKETGKEETENDKKKDKEEEENKVQVEENTGKRKGLKTGKGKTKSWHKIKSKNKWEEGEDWKKLSRSKHSFSPSNSDQQTEYDSPASHASSAFPGYSSVAHNMAVIGSENGTYKSFCKLISCGFQVADRILALTPWGSYALFKTQSKYFLFDGCICNPERFRHLDLRLGTAGLLSFPDSHQLILKIITGKTQGPTLQSRRMDVDSICREFC